MVERRIEVPGGAGSSPALTTNNAEGYSSGEESSFENCQVGPPAREFESHSLGQYGEVAQ